MRNDDELLKRTIVTKTVKLSSIRGPKNPVIGEDVTYTCVIYPEIPLKGLQVKFGFSQSPNDFAYHVVSFSPNKVAGRSLIN